MDKQTRSLQHLAHRYLSRLLEAYPSLFETISELDRGERLRLGLRSEHCKNVSTLRTFLAQSAAQPDARLQLLEQNIGLFARQMGDPSGAVTGLLTLATHLVLSPSLVNLFSNAVGDDTLPNSLECVAIMLGEEADTLHTLLADDHWLIRCEYVSLDTHQDFEVSFDMSASHARRLLLKPLDSPMDLLEDTLVCEPPSTLTLADFAPLQPEGMLQDLQLWHQQPQAGLNLMFWGNPGTGKTECARLIASLAGYTLYSVMPRELRGRDLRLNDVMLAQEVLRHAQRTMLLLDEADDLLLPLIGGSIGKARRHQMLMRNPMPVIWAMNDFPLVEESTQRRFTWITRFARPNRLTRRRLFTESLRGLRLPVAQIEQWCDREWLSAGHITQVAALCRRLGMQGKAAIPFIERWLDEREQALQIDKPPRYRLAGQYDLSLLNPRHNGVPLPQLMANLARQQEGRILLYGAPGTGKTAFVHHLGQVLDKPVIQKRASDLLSKWVGGSEQQIAGAFREAGEQGAILFIDEVDSLLSDRQSHQRSFETSQVNELLSWMEVFDGILLMATNLRDRLDGAVGRRFDYQIELCALQPEQLARKLVALLGKREGGQAATQLHELDNLTLGDLAVLERRKQLNGGVSRQEVVETLQQMAREKHKGSRPIGFLAA